MNASRVVHHCQSAIRTGYIVKRTSEAVIAIVDIFNIGLISNSSGLMWLASKSVVSET